MTELMPPTRSAWQNLFENHARRRFPEKIREVVAASERHLRTDQVPQLATLLRGALIAEEEIESRTLAELVQLALETVLISGASHDFDEYTQFFASTLEIIDLLQRRGHTTTSLLLSAARFEARLGNGNDRRRQFIEQAVRVSTTPAEQLTALLTLAKYRIDVSQYRKCRQVLAHCRRITDTGAGTEFVPDLETTTGISYYYAEPQRAQRHFRAAIELGKDRMSEPDVRRAVSAAFHYLGRIAADRDDHERAVELYVKAEDLSDKYLSSHGFYHQRVAEVLVDHGSVEESSYHLTRANEAYRRVGQASTALAILDITWARLHIRTGELAKAERTMLRGIALSRSHTSPRAELALSLELLALRLRQRSWSESPQLLLRCAWLYFHAEATGGPVTIVRQLVRLIKRASRTLHHSRSALTSITMKSLISCPCGADHEQRQ